MKRTCSDPRHWDSLGADMGGAWISAKRTIEPVTVEWDDVDCADCPLCATMSKTEDERDEMQERLEENFEEGIREGMDRATIQDVRPEPVQVIDFIGERRLVEAIGVNCLDYMDLDEVKAKVESLEAEVSVLALARKVG